ncbi:MAG: mce related protein [Xanthobacteraceae bacterium]|jgi:phospholipid/cholesterol/gamma-HCH transport system substrate-binding protein|nr:mce related protein [Xanthobacteraceae bacterium]
METKANYVLIGLFTLAVIVGVFGFIYWFQSIGTGGERATYRVVFDGSVSGLRTGANVLFNGLRVGEVADLRLNPGNPAQVVATISVDSKTPIRSDTKAGLDFQGLTGIANLSLSGGSMDRPALVSTDGAPPVLRADPSASQDVTQAARELVKRIDGFLAENQESVHKSIVNIETITTTLARNSDRFDNVMAGLEKLTGDKGEIQVAAIEFQQAAKSFRQLSDNLDRRTAAITAELTRFTGSGLREFQALSADGRRTLGEIERTVKNFDRNPQRLIFGGGKTVPEYRGR